MLINQYFLNAEKNMRSTASKYNQCGNPQELCHPLCLMPEEMVIKNAYEPPSLS